MGQAGLCAPDNCSSCQNCGDESAAKADGRCQEDLAQSPFYRPPENEVHNLASDQTEASDGLMDLAEPKAVSADRKEQRSEASTRTPWTEPVPQLETPHEPPAVAETEISAPPKKRPENVGETLVSTDPAVREKPAPTPAVREEPAQTPAVQEEPAQTPAGSRRRSHGSVHSNEERHYVDPDYAKSRNSNKVSGKLFPKRPLMCKLSQKAWDKVADLYKQIDKDGAQTVTREKALEFFNSFKKVSAEAMFNEVDVDKSGAITASEFMDFWVQVRASGYSEELIVEEIEQIMEGGSWVDWKDNRSTSAKGMPAYPKRPILCRLSSKAWALLQELFLKMSGEEMVISKSKANAFFKGAFAHVSTEAMFNEVDVAGHGCITAQEWVSFWVQVRSSGYKEKQILEEVDQLLEGGTWVDWADGRHT